jgi:hypothetical protein
LEFCGIWSFAAYWVFIAGPERFHKAIASCSIAQIQMNQSPRSTGNNLSTFIQSAHHDYAL